ncbi:hypothetical protein VAC_DPP12_033 [Vaccinia virus]|uniref:IL-1 receptor antagonist n=1 Tax=Vaccinia virus TaxID=10245 RepID=H2DW63_VACCV|nr:hypothetical protein VAC_DPP12_033 [Vaccinia virus]AEY73549.1 hypothetical protein VAC_DPP13_033 [Vaccinia virus]AEY73780.1 hypothetical protein VAC_DPP15_033 [Vaccinia virus]AEY74018.1 hypothetical protein VAC_DPP16_033 [Vaccinia virus]AEY74258.1 hypothetical protein VAC_DPP17_033 [Vaccinia virus]
MDTIKIFNHGAFDTIKNELVNLLKVVKWNTINSNVTVSSTDTINISERYYINSLKMYEI